MQSGGNPHVEFSGVCLARLDAFFFSCLGLAKSAYYIIKDDQGSRYRDAIHSWRMNLLNHKGRTQFNRMMKLRDKMCTGGDPTEERSRQ